jgi:site-specific DNA recombinase
MQAGLSGLMSDELRAGIRVRTHSALQMRATTGRSTGGKVYGYDPAGEIVEAEAAIVREIFGRTAAGESMRTITNDLNGRDVPSPGARWNRTERRRDGRWLISALNGMLQNERYIGRLIWNRSEWVKDPDSASARVASDRKTSGPLRSVLRLSTRARGQRCRRG